MAGNILAYSLVNRGQAPNFLHPQLYSAITEELHSAHPVVADITDVDMRTKLTQVI